MVIMSRGRRQMDDCLVVGYVSKCRAAVSTQLSLHEKLFFPRSRAAAVGAAGGGQNGTFPALCIIMPSKKPDSALKPRTRSNSLV